MARVATIPGEPVGQARPRSFARCPGNPAACAAKQCRPFVTVYTKDTDKAWRAAARAALERYGKPTMLEGPVGLSMLFLRTMPKGEQRKTSVPPRRWDASYGFDIDNLAKAVMDLLVAEGWLKDDSQVARLVVEKVVGAQGETPRVTFALWPLEPYRAPKAREQDVAREEGPTARARDEA